MVRVATACGGVLVTADDLELEEAPAEDREQERGRDAERDEARARAGQIEPCPR